MKKERITETQLSKFIHNLFTYVEVHKVRVSLKAAKWKLLLES